MIEDIMQIANGQFILRQSWTGMDYAVWLVENVGEDKHIVFAHVGKNKENADHLFALAMNEWELYT